MKNLIREFEGLLASIKKEYPDDDYHRGTKDMLGYVIGRLDTESKKIVRESLNESYDPAEYFTHVMMELEGYDLDIDLIREIVEMYYADINANFSNGYSVEHTAEEILKKYRDGDEPKEADLSRRIGESLNEASEREVERVHRAVSSFDRGSARVRAYDRYVRDVKVVGYEIIRAGWKKADIQEVLDLLSFLPADRELSFKGRFVPESRVTEGIFSRRKPMQSDEDPMEDIHKFGRFMLHVIKEEMGFDRAYLSGMGRRKGMPRVGIEIEGLLWEFYLNPEGDVVVAGWEREIPREKEKMNKYLGMFGDVETIVMNLESIPGLV